MTLQVEPTKESQEDAIGLFMRASATTGDQLYGVGIASTATVHAYAESKHEAFEQARRNLDTGGFSVTGIDGREIESVDEDLFVDGYYDDSYPAYELTLAGFARRWCLAGDPREVSHAVRHDFDHGDFESVYQADEWIARWNEVEPTKILHPRDELDRMIAEFEETDKEPIFDPGVDQRVTDALLQAAYYAREAGDDEFAERIHGMRSEYATDDQDGDCRVPPTDESFRVTTKENEPALELPDGRTVVLRTFLKTESDDSCSLADEVPSTTEIDADDFAWWNVVPSGDQTYPVAVIEPEVREADDE